MLRIRLVPTLLVSAAVASAVSGYAKTHVDATQAQAVVGLLRECSAGPVSAQAIDRVIALSGTQLIIGQQNISRRITTAQYREVLVAACSGAVAHVKPFEAGARAEKGAQGLTEDVAPSLIWGRQHIPELQKRLAVAEAHENFDGVVPLSLKNLPESVELSPKLYFSNGRTSGCGGFGAGDLYRSAR